MLTFEDTLERELFLKRRFTYKVMKKLFMSFSHEFGTSLNCILSVSQSAVSSSEIPQKIINAYV